MMSLLMKHSVPGRRAWIAPAVLAALTSASAANADQAHLVSYGVYGAAEALVVRGRAHRGKPASGLLDRSTPTKVASTVHAFTLKDIKHPRIAVTDTASGKTIEVEGDAEGFYEARLPGPFPSGSRQIVVCLRHKKYIADPVVEDVLVVDTRPVLVTDIDDTLIDTGVTGSKTDLVARMLSHDAADVKPLEGAADTLRAFAAEGIPVIYLSASPVELAPRVRQVLSLGGFPPGPLFLRYYQKEGHADPSAYKRRVLNKLVADLPRAHFILLGDNGEKDPAIFAELANRTGRVSHRFIRATLAQTLPEGAFVFKAYAELMAHARVQKLIP